VPRSPPCPILFFAHAADFEAVGERLVRVLLGLPELRPGRGARKGSIADAEALAAEALTLESEVQVGELVGRRMAERLPAEILASAAL
jgi:hypothetical protein